MAADPLGSVVARIEQQARGSDRYVIGITGSPGSGKTTLATAIVERIRARTPGSAAHLPMDGFHLANATLDRLSIRDRKGAIDTFDGRGFVALLSRVRRETDHTVYAPSFRRSVDEGIAGEIAIEPAARVVVVEGNYLLADKDPWIRVRGLLDTVWFCEAPADVREERLVARHMRHGRTREQATVWAREVDGANARLIEQTAGRADGRISGVGWAM